MSVQAPSPSSPTCPSLTRFSLSSSSGKGWVSSFATVNLEQWLSTSFYFQK